MQETQIHNRAWKWWRQKRPGNSKLTSDFYFGSTKVWLCYCHSMWVHSHPLMSYAGVTFTSPPVVSPPPVAKSVCFTGYIDLLWVRRIEMCLDPYKNWIQVDPVFEFLKLLLCCDVALSSHIASNPGIKTIPGLAKTTSKFHKLLPPRPPHRLHHTLWVILLQYSSYSSAKTH